MKKLILIFIVIIVGGGILWWQQQMPNNDNKQLTKQDVFKNWQTYTNTKYGFELKYQSDIGYLSPEGGGWLGYLSNNEAKETNILILGKKAEKNILVINAGFENKNILMREFSNNEDRYNISDANINGVDFKKYSVKNGIYNGYNTAYLYEDENNFITIKFVETPLANQIISTFKLTE